MLLWIIVAIWFFSALATIDVYRRKGYGGGFGAVVGFMLGPLGLIIAAFKPPKQ